MPSINFTLDDVLARIDSRPAGVYTLRGMFGDEWRWCRRRQHLGKLFKAAVLHDDVPRVRWVRQRSDRTQEYEVS